MTRNASIALSLLLLTSAAVVTAAEHEPVKFTRPLAVTKDGVKTVIEFAVSRQTDMAVYIEDSAGKVVRHLVAGALAPAGSVQGGKKPAPPLKAGLSQSLAWDGKDDYGKEAVGGPFKV